MSWLQRFLIGRAIKQLDKEVLKMPRSWRTTLVGVLMILGLVANAGVTILDGDPATTVDLKILLAGLGVGWGFIVARDQKAHEEERR